MSRTSSRVRLQPDVTVGPGHSRTCFVSGRSRSPGRADRRTSRRRRTALRPSTWPACSTARRRPRTASRGRRSSSRGRPADGPRASGARSACRSRGTRIRKEAWVILTHPLSLRIADRGLRTGIDRHAAMRIALAALAFRLLSAFLAFYANVVFPLDRPEQLRVFSEPSAFWDTFVRYDTGYFEGIAWNGYTPVEGGRSNIAYFPVYPMLMRGVGKIFGRHHATFYIAGIAIAWICFIGAMVALYSLARLDLNRRLAERAV